MGSSSGDSRIDSSSKGLGAERWKWYIVKGYIRRKIIHHILDVLKIFTLTSVRKAIFQTCGKRKEKNSSPGPAHPFVVVGIYFVLEKKLSEAASRRCRVTSAATTRGNIFSSYSAILAVRRLLVSDVFIQGGMVRL